MRDHDDRRLVLAVDLGEALQQIFRRFGVERAGWLVGENDRRIHDQRPASRAPLFLTARKLIWIFVEMVRQPEKPGELFSFLERDSRFFAIERKRQHNVVEQRHRVQKGVVLEDEANGIFSQFGELFGRKACEVASVQNHMAACRPVDRGNQVQQRGLAGSARPHDGDKVFLVNGKADIVQHRLAIAAVSVYLL